MSRDEGLPSRALAPLGWRRGAIVDDQLGYGVQRGDEDDYTLRSEIPIRMYCGEMMSPGQTAVLKFNPEDLEPSTPRARTSNPR